MPLHMSFFFMLVFCSLSSSMVEGGANESITTDEVLDSGLTVGIASNASISAMFHKFYEIPHHRRMQMVINGVDSAVPNMMKMVEMQAMIGPEALNHADFLPSMVKKASRPVLFSDADPSQSSLYANQVIYFIRMAQNNLSHITSIATSILNNQTNASDLLLEVSHAMMDRLPSSCSYDYFSYTNGHDGTSRYYDKLIYESYSKKFDTVLGDATIAANRTIYVNLTHPYAESGVSMIIPGKTDDHKERSWSFMKPLPIELWLIISGLFLLVAILVWIFERRSGPDFRGPPSRHIGQIFWFSFSTLVFAHREKPESNYTRFITNLVKFVVLILVMGYAASQTSMFMVEKLRSTVKVGRMESSLQSRVVGSSYIQPSRNDSSRHLSSSDIQKNHSAIVEHLVAVLLPEGPAGTRCCKTNNTLTIAVSDKNGFHEFLLVGDDVPTTADINVDALMEVIDILPYNVSHRSLQFQSGYKDATGSTASSVIEGAMISKSLRIAVPAKSGFPEFINHKGDLPIVVGFSIDVFKEVMNSLPYQVSYIPYETGHEDDEGYYDELIYKLYLKEYDGVVGGITITANRSKFVDFTQPYMMSGISMVVPIEDDDDMKSLWWFLKPMTAEMWVVTIALFMLKGILVWIFEHGTNEEFQGTPSQQVGKILCVSFALFASAEKEKLQSNYSRFIVNIWTVAVLLLAACYVAIISSILTAEKLQPAATDIESLVESGKCVGYQKGSFVLEFLKQMGFEESKLKAYTTREEYAEGFLKGSGNNGVSAVVDEIPYLKVFLAEYGHRYAMVGPIHRRAGLGFAFQRGSKVVPRISRAILELTEEDKMFELEQKWFRRRKTSSDPHQTPVVPKKISLSSFRGVLLITELTSGVALFIFIILFIYKRKTIGNGNGSSSPTSFVGPRNNQEALGNYSIEITANQSNEEGSHGNRERERDLVPEDGQLDEGTTQDGVHSCEEDCCSEEC